ncbi:MAG: biopolymer transporter ExbD [Acidobacteria bacterium]|nr:biopolymer transporter ExbD [Acidobacteriota bacterium]
MAMAVGATKGPKADINITPYIDILLVLLIIFMVITPKIQRALDAKAPQPSPPTQKGLVTGIVVSIDANNDVMINQDPVTLGDLGARLLEIYNARADKTMFIKGDPSLPYGDVVRVIDIAKGAGVGDIGLITSEIGTGASGGASQ